MTPTYWALTSKQSEIDTYISHIWEGIGIYISDYRLLSANPGCPGGCAYTKDGDSSSEVWCMGEGSYTPNYTCPSTTKNPGNEVISSHLNTH